MSGNRHRILSGNFECAREWQPCENDASSFVAATFFLCKDYCIFLIFHETLLSLNLLQQRFILFKDDFTFWIFIVCAIYVRMYLCMCV